jgi:hypothetical protein
MVAQKVLSGMSALMDELIQSHLLDDDDEEADEGWLDDHHKREKRFLDEAISDGLDKYPDLNAIHNLPPNCDPRDCLFIREAGYRRGRRRRRSLRRRNGGGDGERQDGRAKCHRSHDASL